ncbi:MAG: tetratricopeptide repeat protein [Polyangiaceae bacterium]
MGGPGAARLGVAVAAAALVLVGCDKDAGSANPRGEGAAPSASAPLTGTWRLAADRGSRAFREGKFEEAEKNLRAALAALEKAVPDHPELGGIHYDLGSLYSEQRKLDLAYTHLTKARELLTRHHGVDHPDVQASLHMIAVVLDYQGKTEQAEKRFRELMAAAEKSHGPDHLDVAQACNSVALTLAKQDKGDEARAFYQRAADITEKLGNDEYRAYAVNGLATLAYKQDRFDDAADHLALALKLREKVHGKDHPLVATVLFNYAGVEAARGKLERAAELCARCVAIRDVALPPDHPWQMEAIERCIAINEDLGRDAEVRRFRGKLGAKTSPSE